MKSLSGAVVKSFEPVQSNDARNLVKLHSKMVIFDEKSVLTGSSNWSKAASRRNLELILTFDNVIDTKKFLDVWNQFWDHGNLGVLSVDDSSSVAVRCMDVVQLTSGIVLQ